MNAAKTIVFREKTRILYPRRPKIFLIHAQDRRAYRTIFHRTESDMCRGYPIDERRKYFRYLLNGVNIPNEFTMKEWRVCQKRRNCARTVCILMPSLRNVIDMLPDPSRQRTKKISDGPLSNPSVGVRNTKSERREAVGFRNFRKPT